MFGGNKKRKLRVLTFILATALIVGGVVSGTVAWLIADTTPVVNTFSYGDIDLELDETKTDKKGNPVDADEDGNPEKTIQGNEYEMIPGKSYHKDPTVTVLAGNEACWLFVKLEKEGGATVINADGSTTTYGFDDYLTYTIENGWTQLYEEGSFGVEGKEIEGVYYQLVSEGTDTVDRAYPILMGNEICVLGTVTKEMLNALDDNGQNTANATYPSLSATAYAVQYSGFEAEVTDGVAATNQQVNTAVLNAWKAVETQNSTTNP